MHPDFMKNATSEQSIFVGMKLGLPNFLYTPLASSASVKAKAKAFSQVIAKRALAAGLYSTPTRQRTKFKADMIDETSDLDPSLQSLQPFGSSHVGVSDAADNFALLFRLCANNLLLQQTNLESRRLRAQFLVLVALFNSGCTRGNHPNFCWQTFSLQSCWQCFVCHA